MKIFVILTAILAASMETHADPDKALAVTYYHYPPKLRVEDGKPAGPYADGLEAIAAKAGLQLEWLASTINEEARMLNDGRRSFCTTGRYYTAERGARWAFLPYQFDTIPADVTVTTKEMAPVLRAHGSMAAVVRDKAILGTLLGSGVYGREIDEVLRTEPGWIYRDGKTDFQLINMLLANRAQYAIVPEDQWQEALEANPDVNRLVMIPDLGTLPQTPLYLVCSRGVDADILARLDKAMGDLGYPHLPPGQ